MADWLRNEILNGLQMLLVLRLRGSPAVETAPAMAKIWIAAITSSPIAWDAERDAPRLRQAFLTLARTREDWPAPKALLEALPQTLQPLRLTPPQSHGMPPEVRAQINAFLKRSQEASGLEK